ncbi:hypothetical protein [Stenotrophomonas rhizophila]|uniref:hypothetical protein n=1 Tax=Stenotrophomonas rhizophila TaxID=216778 RepID=UPI00119DA660|nr:hypothetical protein [Stenotrophomonas rhizophila]
MAGAILIGEMGDISIGTIPFALIVNRIRSTFLPGEIAVRNKVFSPIDDGGMNFISAIDLSSDEFHAFAAAVEEVYRARNIEGNLIVHESVWREIIDAIKMDSRYGGHGHI